MAYKIWFYGKHAVRAALANKRRKKLQLYYCGKPEADIQALAKEAGVSMKSLDPKQLHALLSDKQDKNTGGGKIIHQNIALEVESLPPYHIEEIITPADKPCLLLLLDRLDNVQNIGAILRSAYLLGVDAVLAEDWQESAHLARASAGALESMKLVACGNIAQMMERLKKHEFWVAGLDMQGDDIANFNPATRQLLVMGNEEKGLHRLVKEKCDFLCRIPIYDRINSHAPESLNVSVSAGIALHVIGQKFMKKNL